VGVVVHNPGMTPTDATHGASPPPSLAELEEGLDHVRAAPAAAGTLELIVRRPAEERRELLEAGQLDLREGLIGDMWHVRGSPSTADGGPNPNAQVTVMNARAAALVAGDANHERWAQAGDQLYVDLDISEANLPAGSRLAIGEAVLEITAEPHLGCGKFSRRFGVDALKVVNSAEGRALRLRGVNARVVQPGAIARGHAVRVR
jgi:MOSC domain-containing protein YiiM